MRKLLVLNKYFFPAYKAGGSTRSVTNLVHALSRTPKPGWQIDVFTKDRDFLDSKPFEGVIPDELNSQQNYQVLYNSPSRLRTVINLLALLRENSYDVVYLNSFFAPFFSILPFVASLFLAPQATIVLAPRGEFSQQALNLKRRKKQIFLGLFRCFGLHKKIVWHVSNRHELQQLTELFGTNIAVKVASNLPGYQMLPEKLENDDDDVLRIACVSRVNRIKNVALAIAYVSELDRKAVLHIYGPIDDPEYWALCQQKISDLRSSQVSIEYCGPISHSEVVDTISRYDLFLSLSQSENFGHSIVEAWVAGTAVLISDNTPWRHLEEQGLGASFDPNNKLDIISYLNTFSKSDSRKRRLHRNTFVKNQILNGQVLEDNLRVFQDLERS